jgi:hypothetical protein
MKKLRRITEAEVIAEFLQGEFYQKEYDADREQFVDIVNHPDLSSEAENTLRQALFFRRRDTLWWELPEERQWWEIELEPADIERVNVFPRARWLRLARGNFKAQNVAEQVRRQMAEQQPDQFAAKMAAISSSMESAAAKGLIVFLGLDERRPVTLLEGNHRFVASLLEPGKNLLAGARMVAVFSPSMETCCWYKTSFQTLFRCLKNRIQHYWDRDPDVAALLQQIAGFRNSGVSVERPGPVKSRTV